MKKLKPGALPEFGLNYGIVAKKSDSPQNEATVYVYGDIGESWWGEETVAARTFVKEIDAIDAEILHVRFNSFGGVCADGIAIFNALKRQSAKVIGYVDGVAVSIASYILAACDEIKASVNSQIMVHPPWTYTYGNSGDLRESADDLDRYAGLMMAGYASKVGNDLARTWMMGRDDHWYTAEEAKTVGFVNDVIEDNSTIVAADYSLRFNRGERKIMARKTDPASTQENTDTVENSVSNTPVGVNIEDIRTQVKAEEKVRQEGIRAVFAPFMDTAGMRSIYDECMHSDDTADTARVKILAHMEAQNKEVKSVASNASVKAGEDARDKFRVGATLALENRAGFRSESIKDDPARNEFRGMTLAELARESLARVNVSARGMDRRELVSAAFTHTGSDFPNILSDVARKSMLRGAEEAEETFRLWTSKGTLTDFKPTKRVDLNEFPSLPELPEGSEYTYGTFGDRGETVQLATYGRMFSITRQGIINDDMDMLSRVPLRMGRAAIRTVGNLVYVVLTGNPTMSDGVVLFHANHANLLTGAAPATASVDAMGVAMGKHKDAGENATALNIALKYLLVPLALRGAALQVRNNQFEVSPTLKTGTAANYMQGTFEVVADARLDAVSATAWYGAANPNAHDTVEVSWLDGNETPYLEQQNGWNVDGTSFKVRIDAGVRALDWRTLAKNPGA